MYRFKTNGFARLFFIGLGALVFIAIHRPAQGQELQLPGPHQGYYFSLGAHGLINTNQNEESGTLGPWPGITGSLRLGQALAPWLDLGLDIGMGSSFDKEYYTLLGHLGLSAQLRPWEPLFFRLGIGFGATDFSRRQDGLDKVTGQAGGWYALAVGYEIFHRQRGCSGGLSLTPIVGIDVGPGDPTSSFNAWAGIELTWWTGLPKNQLELPVEQAYE